MIYYTKSKIIFLEWMNLLTMLLLFQNQVKIILFDMYLYNSLTYYLCIYVFIEYIVLHISKGPFIPI